MLSNKVVGVDDAEICENCRCQIKFQTLLQAASIGFFFRLLNTLYLETLTQNKQLYD